MFHGTDQAFGGADHQQAPRGGGALGPGDEGPRGHEAARSDDTDVLPVRKEYGGLKTDQAKKLKELERENARLKKLLAEAHLDKAMLQEVASGNF